VIRNVSPRKLVREAASTRHHNGLLYLFGDCGAGIALRFGTGTKVEEVRTVDRTEADRIRALPVLRGAAEDALLEGLGEAARRRLDELVVEIREAIQQGMAKWIEVGERLAEAKKLLARRKGDPRDKGDFTVWVRRNGMDPVNAFKLIRCYEVFRASPNAQKLFLSIGQEKTVLLTRTRLSDAKRLEILQHGVPLDGVLVPLERVTYRQLAAYVRSLVGRDPRGRKPRTAAPEPKPKERLGLPIEIQEAFKAIIDGLRTLRKKDAAGWAPKERPAARNYWHQIWGRTCVLHDGALGALADGGS
jgi:hypothetical protein